MLAKVYLRTKVYYEPHFFVRLIYTQAHARMHTGTHTHTHTHT